MHNSRRPLNHLQYVFARCKLWPWAFNPKIISLVGYPKVIPCRKFEHFGIIHFWVIVQTDTQTYRQTHMNTLLLRLLSMWVINRLLSNKNAFRYSVKNCFINKSIIHFRHRQVELWDLIAAEAEWCNKLVCEAAVKCWKGHGIVPDQQKQEDKEPDQVRPNIQTVVIPCKQAEINNKLKDFTE